MGIQFKNLIGNSGFCPPTSSPKKNVVAGQTSFLSLLTKASDGPERLSTRSEDSQWGLQTPLALCKKMELQMNESLLRILSDSEGENSGENFLTDPMAFFEQGSKEASFLSIIQQDPSKIPPGIQVSDRVIEEIPEINEGVQEIDSIIRQAATVYGVNMELIRGVIQAESDFNPNAISPKGAAGLMQLMPDTAKELGVTDPFDPTENIMGGTRYLKNLLDHYDGSEPLALAAYNWGIGNMESQRSNMPAETRNYVAKITGVELKTGLEG